MSSSSVWVQLYYKGKDEPNGQPVKIKVTPEDVADLKAAVLPKLDPAELTEVFVYPAGTTPTFSPDESLDPGGDLPLGTTSKNPLIVVAPDPQQTQDLSKGPSIQQEQKLRVSQFSETARVGLELMGEEYLTSKRTIRLSEATCSSKTELMDMLGLPERGASWPNKPDISQTIDGYSWREGHEDSVQNRTAYMAHLGNLLNLPEGYVLADMRSNKQLLTVELLRETMESRKIRGTTDVAIVRSEHFYNEAVRNNIETLFELKTTKHISERDHTPQTIVEHLAASYLNRTHPVVSVLTDLNEKWTFFWFGRREGERKIALYKLCLDGRHSAAEAQYILGSLYDSSVRGTLPTTFGNRQPFEAVFDCAFQNKRSRRHFDQDGSDSPDKDSKPPPSGGAGRHPTSGTHGASSSTSRGIEHRTDQGDSSGGCAGHTSMANALSLFAPPVHRDVANELDLLDMVDENEQYEIIRSFAEKHIVPHMRPVA